MKHRIIDQLFFIPVCILISIPLADRNGNAQSQPLPSKKFDLVVESFEVSTDASLRGLCVVNKDVIWASGSGGTVVRTIDSGKSWKKFIVPDSTEIEFRDIEAFDEKRAIILGAGTPARVYTTNNGGETWQLRYENKDERVFFDAFSFWDENKGIAFSDPLDGKLFLIQTVDGGKSWKVHDRKNAPTTLSSEAGFAASGTCLASYGTNHVWIGLGGKPEPTETKNARAAISSDNGGSWKLTETTIPRSESAGVFSLAFIDQEKVVAVGGDYKQPLLFKNTVSITFDGGKSWKPANATGFRSCVAVGRFKSGKSNMPQTVLLATGTNGTDWSMDTGISWELASEKGFHALGFVKDSNVCWASGGNGKIARLTFQTKQ